MLVADRQGDEIRRFDPAGKCLGNWTAIGVAADLDGNANVAVAGNNRIAVVRLTGTFFRNLTTAGLHNPHGPAIDGDLLYDADRGNGRVAVLDLAGAPQASMATAGSVGVLRDPVGVALDRDGHLLLTDEDLRRVIVYQSGEGVAALIVAVKREKGDHVGR